MYIVIKPRLIHQTSRNWCLRGRGIISSHNLEILTGKTAESWFSTSNLRMWTHLPIFWQDSSEHFLKMEFSNMTVTIFVKGMTPLKSQSITKNSSFSQSILCLSSNISWDRLDAFLSDCHHPLHQILSEN